MRGEGAWPSSVDRRVFVEETGARDEAGLFVVDDGLRAGRTRPTRGARLPVFRERAHAKDGGVRRRGEERPFASGEVAFGSDRAHRLDVDDGERRAVDARDEGRAADAIARDVRGGARVDRLLDADDGVARRHADVDDVEPREQERGDDALARRARGRVAARVARDDDEAARSTTTEERPEPERDRARRGRVGAEEERCARRFIAHAAWLHRRARASYTPEHFLPGRRTEPTPWQRARGCARVAVVVERGPTLIKYLGSKRVLVEPIVDALLSRAHDPRERPLAVADLFSGTSRVGIALRRRGARVVANDHNAYAAAIARCYLEASLETHARDAALLVDELNRLPGRAGYFTETFSIAARYVHPTNGARVDAIREAIAHKSLDPVLESVLLTSLLEATDRVDSTCGVQMAYLKEWAARAHKPLTLRVPELVSLDEGPPGTALHMDALDAAALVDVDVAYLDPPYNQHSYLGNYHVWESLTLWDKPAVYGRAMKRVDVRERKSAFNRRASFASSFAALIESVRAPTVAVSFSDEGFLSIEELRAILSSRGEVTAHAFAHKRYIGAQIGIFNPAGERVGTPGKSANTEHLFVVERHRDRATSATSDRRAPFVGETDRARFRAL